ncbi:amino acid adenylation domain-containing protein [Desmonostoc muscorum LEGE 12446]|uniref:Amino acid adenylation domain-containing protein n=1 Tax=Desmonostoc muscorum LEGE 12446 TaxID=1828758 RepID=A0A8J7AB66_DESMC|nr:amino acid adenylation domain-containing protein [Desmonostoc muscorum]MCF2146809.1 amino acid adenylation domain-containing protein [Desmonostoc muscorum LEGE 12446]
MIEKFDFTLIHKLVENQVEKSPQAVAVICQNEQLSYEELNQKANQVAHYLQKLGVKPEVLVGVCVERSLDMVIALLGILKAGGAYIPVDPSYPQERLEFMLEDSQMPILVTQKHLIKQLPRLENVRVVCIDTDWQVITQYSTENLHSKVTGENLAYTIYTSGSTGKPKGVQIKHRSVVNLLNSMQREPGLTAEDTLLAITTISFDMAVPDLYLPLVVGARIKLIERQVASDAAELAKVLSEPEVTFVQATPATWQLVLAAGWQGNKRLKILCGGEALMRSLANQLLEKGGSLWHMYGPTETTVWSMIYKVEPGSNSLPLGRPIDNTQIYLLEQPKRRENDPMKIAPIGTPGEVYIGGEGVARGYLNRPELNRDRFVHHPFSNEPEARLYKTGDLARYLPDGNLEFIGRIDNQVKIRGFRVELGDIERVLSQHPYIKETVVISKEDNFGNKRLIAYVVPNTHHEKLVSSQLIEQSYTEQIQQWEKVWSSTYSQFPEDWAGYNDSFTGLLIPANEVCEWVDDTVERILSLCPQRVLEIGCGKGLLLFRIAPYCSHYVGTDISAEAIHYIEQQLKNDPQHWSHVKVSDRAAHELAGLEPASFDTVIINSVIQYFPSVDYLLQAIEKSVKLVKPGGQIFIGDVRSLPLLETFHTAVQLGQATSSLSSHQLQQMIRERIFRDRELVLDPDFFPALKQRIPRISHVQTLLKRGHSQNELIRFRSDVILHIETDVYPDAEPLCWDWQQQDISIPQICKFLQEKQPKTLKIINVPNARVFRDVKAVELLASANQPPTVGQLKQTLWQIPEQTTVHPEEFWNISQYLPYKSHITWSELNTPDTYDVVLQSQLKATNQRAIVVLPEQPLELKPLSAYANNPLQVNQKTNLVPQLRTYLKEKLPDYMVPSAFVVMETLPLTPNGKIDRRSLPEPKKERPMLTEAYVPPSTLLENQLAEIWSQILGIEQVGVEDNFFELGGHSLLTVQLLAQVEEIVHIKLPLFYLLKEPTISGLIKSIDVLQNLDSMKPVEEFTKVDLLAQAVLDPTIRPEIPFVEPTTEPKHILLTGATGFLGAFLLHELLQQTSADIYCLVRASNFAEGRYKIQTNLERYMLWSGELNSRIIPLLGDLSRPFLGLNHQRFQELAHKLDLIYHSGAFVNLIYPYKALRATNVLGTQEILRLASLGKVTPVHFISTIDVLEPLIFNNPTPIPEDELLVDGEKLTRGYAQTKWVAEQLVMAAQSRGIPACIYRPGMISGHSQTGTYHINDLIARIIKGMIQLGTAPDLDQSINITPIDYASKAIVHLSRQRESLGKAFHIVNPHPLPWKKLVSEIRSFGYSIQLQPNEKWQTELLQLDISQENVLNPIKSLFTEKSSQTHMTYFEAFLLTAQAFDYQNTLNGLRETSIVCPPANTKLLSTYLSYFIQCGFLVPSLSNFEENRSTAKEWLGTATKWDDCSGISESNNCYQVAFSSLNE